MLRNRGWGFPNTAFGKIQRVTTQKNKIEWVVIPFRSTLLDHGSFLYFWKMWSDPILRFIYECSLRYWQLQKLWIWNFYQTLLSILRHKIKKEIGKNLSGMWIINQNSTKTDTLTYKPSKSQSDILDIYFTVQSIKYLKMLIRTFKTAYTMPTR